MTDEHVRGVVADMLVAVGHGNPMFITQVRQGQQDDGPYMQAAFAVRNEVMRMVKPAPEAPLDE